MLANLLSSPLLAEAAGSQVSVIEIVMDADAVVTAILVLLAVLSVISWYIIGYKALYFRRAQAESQDFMDVFWQSKRLDAIYQSSEEFPRAPVSRVFKAGYIELSKLKGSTEGAGAESMRQQLGDIENVERSLRRASRTEMTELEKLVPFLATVGSTSPFIGLLGTVWGIMVAFLNISAEGAAGIDVVGQPIAEALIVTAMGLFAAIPAVVAYNLFVNKIKVLGGEMDNFSSDFLNIVKRHFFK
ncbi:protein TolQ [Lujinxingia vulgaris]|uniref:Protein TolQ n=1 Tax=Lujinxingia vulgaris TaxID=2600176 RepID=A0A5C6XIT3_9DELT|nr:protein TolQ [Lujinxingia vulgaris]TXD39428.1 protein TolQ [Lujinxingia vulgaris]